MQPEAASISTTAEYVNTVTAAKILNVSYSHLRVLLRKGQGPRFTQLGRARRFSVEALHRFMRERESQ